MPPVDTSTTKAADGEGLSAALLDSGGRPQPFSLLLALHGDQAMAEIFSEEATIASWLQVEAALARAQAAASMISSDEAEAIAEAALALQADTSVLWGASRNVGYPILPLVKALSASLPEGPAGKVHYGATTQDIMDTALALQHPARV